MNSEDKKTLGRNIPQIREALSDVNRYYFWIRYKREPRNNNELLDYYILVGGGAKDYAKRNTESKIQESS